MFADGPNRQRQADVIRIYEAKKCIESEDASRPGPCVLQVSARRDILIPLRTPPSKDQEDSSFSVGRFRCTAQAAVRATILTRSSVQAAGSALGPARRCWPVNSRTDRENSWLQRMRALIQSLSSPAAGMRNILWSLAFG